MKAPFQPWRTILSVDITGVPYVRHMASHRDICRWRSRNVSCWVKSWMLSCLLNSPGNPGDYTLWERSPGWQNITDFPLKFVSVLFVWFWKPEYLQLTMGCYLRHCLWDRLHSRNITYLDPSAEIWWWWTGLAEMGDWYNHHRFMERTGYIPPVEAEKAYHASENKRDLTAWALRQNILQVYRGCSLPLSLHSRKKR